MAVSATRVTPGLIVPNVSTLLLHAGVSDLPPTHWYLTGVCPRGDDPQTPGETEVQVLQCVSAGAVGSEDFRLSFRQQITDPLSPTATVAEVKAALEALTTIREVSFGLLCWPWKNASDQRLPLPGGSEL